MALGAFAGVAHDVFPSGPSGAAVLIALGIAALLGGAFAARGVWVRRAEGTDGLSDVVVIAAGVLGVGLVILGFVAGDFGTLPFFGIPLGGALLVTARVIDRRAARWEEDNRPARSGTPIALGRLSEEERDEMIHDAAVATAVFVGTAMGVLLLPILAFAIAL